MASKKHRTAAPGSNTPVFVKEEEVGEFESHQLLLPAVRSDCFFKPALALLRQVFNHSTHGLLPCASTLLPPLQSCMTIAHSRELRGRVGRHVNCPVPDCLSQHAVAVMFQEIDWPDWLAYMFSQSETLLTDEVRYSTVIPLLEYLSRNTLSPDSMLGERGYSPFELLSLKDFSQPGAMESSSFIERMLRGLGGLPFGIKPFYGHYLPVMSGFGPSWETFGRAASSNNPRVGSLLALVCNHEKLASSLRDFSSTLGADWRLYFVPSVRDEVTDVLTDNPVVQAIARALPNQQWCQVMHLLISCHVDSLGLQCSPAYSSEATYLTDHTAVDTARRNYMLELCAHKATDLPGGSTAEKMARALLSNDPGFDSNFFSYTIVATVVDFVSTTAGLHATEAVAAAQASASKSAFPESPDTILLLHNRVSDYGSSVYQRSATSFLSIACPPTTQVISSSFAYSYLDFLRQHRGGIFSSLSDSKITSTAQKMVVICAEIRDAERQKQEAKRQKRENMELLRMVKQEGRE